MRSLDRMNRGDCAEWSPLPRPEVPHCARRSLWFGSIRRTEWQYTFIRRIRNLSLAKHFGVRRCHHAKCSTIRDASTSRKFQILRSKSNESPNSNIQNQTGYTCLGFEHWNVLGVWDLELGISRGIAMRTAGITRGELQRNAVPLTFEFPREP